MARNELAVLLGRAPKHAPYRKYLMASYSENTKRAYEGDVAHFRQWGGRIPSRAVQVAQYLAAHAGKQAYATLSRRLSGIHREHVAKGLRSPVRSELVRATMRGIARTYSRKQRQMLPLLRHHLLKMMPNMRGALGARDKALILLGFLGGFRRSELTALDLEDLQFTNTGITVTIRRSKTDQEALGRLVKVPKLGGPLCCVRALRRWLTVRAGGTPLFTTLTARRRVTSRRMSGGAVAEVIKRRIAEIGLEPGQYSGHSMRVGFVTSAARAGAAIWQIKEQTGQKTDAVVAGYIRDGAGAGASVARLIGRG
jgi:integrase